MKITLGKTNPIQTIKSEKCGRIFVLENNHRIPFAKKGDYRTIFKSGLQRYFKRLLSEMLGA
jgi:hypothetical protein